MYNEVREVQEAVQNALIKCLIALSTATREPKYADTYRHLTYLRRTLEFTLEKAIVATGEVTHAQFGNQNKNTPNVSETDAPKT
jgi:hypothetical protein